MSDDTLLVTDLETTGTDESADSIIEVGCVLTTLDLEVLGHYQNLVTPTDEALGRMMRNDVVRSMHEKNGLLAEILGMDAHARSSYWPHVVSRSLIEWMQDCGGAQGKVIIAGSGVAHFDRRFIKRWMPQWDAFMRHYVVDVGVVRRAHQMWTGTKPPYETTLRGEAAAKTHRALDDCYVHLDEMRAFRRLWRGEG